MTELRRTIRAAVAELGIDVEPASSLAADLEVAAEAVGGEVLLIFDQFEEFFLYHPRDTGEGGFDAEFAGAVTRPDLRANFLISLREDAITRLDRFKARVPYLFDNYLRVRHLDRAAGRAAITGPIEQLNRLAGAGAQPIEIEPELVERVLDDVRAGAVMLADSGKGGVRPAEGGAPADERIETPFLQLVMSRLWDEEAAAGSRVLRLATFERLGGAEQIVRSNLDDALAALPAARQDLVAQIFRDLVTPSGTKVAHAPGDLAAYAGLPESELVEVLEELSDGSVRILRAVADESGNAGGVRYEIFHDVLAAPILEWRRRHVAAAQQAQQEAKRRAAEEVALRERRRARIFRGVAVAAGVFAVAAAVLTVLSIRAQRVAKSKEGAALSTASLATDPAESVRLALGALDAHETPEAEYALRSALGQSRLRTIFAGHRGRVYAASFSPDGGRVATSGEDGTVRIWDARSGKQLAIVDGHGERTDIAQFDGLRVLSAGVRGTVRLSAASSGRQLAVLRPRVRRIIADIVALDAAGTRIATVGPRKGGALLTDAAGKPIRRLADGADVWSVAFSPDGRLVATGETGIVRVWDVRTGGRRSTLTHTDRADPVLHVEFSPGGGRLAISGVQDATVWPDWRVDRGKELRAVGGLVSRIPRFSPDGERLVGIAGVAAPVWSSTTGKRLATLRHQAFISVASFSPDGRRIVTASQDGSARVWSASGAPLADLRGHAGAVSAASFDPDGRRVVTAGADGTARVWDVAEGRVLRGHHKEWLVGVQFSRTGKRVLTTAYDGVRAWDAGRARKTATIPALDGGHLLLAAALSPDGRSVATAYASGRVAIVPFGGRPPLRWRERGGVDAVEFSPDGRLVATAGDPDEKTDRAGVVIRRLGKRTAPVLARRTVQAGTSFLGVRFSPDGRSLVAAAADKTARVWPVSGGAGHVLRGHRSEVLTASFSSDGRRVVTASSDGTVRIWASSGGPAIRALGGFVGAANGASFAHRDRWVVAGGFDGSTRVWDAGTGQPLAVMRVHGGPITAITVSPVDDTIATAGSDGVARLYRCDTCFGLERLREIAEQRVRATRGATAAP